MTRSHHIAIRADASAEIGVGHVMRCLVLANELRRCGVKTRFLCQDITDWAAGQIHLGGHALEMLAPPSKGQLPDAQASIAACKSAGVTLMVVDHYALKTHWCEAVNEAGIVLTVVDDLAETKRQVALLIDPGLGRAPEDYAGLLPPSAKCVAGPAYGLLRPEFSLARDESVPSGSDIRHAVVSLGGSDPDGHSLVCLDALDGVAGIRVSVVLTSGAPHLGAVKQRASNMTVPVDLFVDHADMPSLLASADLALGAGGSSALERCVLGVPTLLLVLAPNQRFNAAQLEASGAAEIATDLGKAALQEQIAGLLADREKLSQMSRAAQTLCDGKGGPRCAAEVLRLMGDPSIRLRDATRDDAELVFGWQNEPGARTFARNPHTPSWQDHSAWFTKRLERAACDPFMIVEAEGAPQGFVRLDQTDDGTWEVSILMAEQGRGKGLGQAALGQLRLAYPDRDIVASVNPDNTASQTLFQAAGFERIEVDVFASPGWGRRGAPAKEDDPDAN